MRGREPDPQSARDAAVMLPFVAAALLLPPIVLIFTAPVLVAGVPLIVVYIFGVWAAIVVAAYVTARRVASAEGEGEAERNGPL